MSPLSASCSVSWAISGAPLLAGPLFAGPLFAAPSEGGEGCGSWGGEGCGSCELHPPARHRRLCQLGCFLGAVVVGPGIDNRVAADGRNVRCGP